MTDGGRTSAPNPRGTLHFLPGGKKLPIRKRRCQDPTRPGGTLRADYRNQRAKLIDFRPFDLSAGISIFYTANLKTFENV
ncbi:MAG: hypothetical protein ACR2IE_08725 [Candidatus Sumerlaeaceae bacterium]